MSEITKTYTRFNIGQRIEHILLIISFMTLVITGLPQKYVGNAWSEWMIGVLGGIETVRIVHHIAAVMFILETIYHLVVMGYKLFVLRLGASMMPSAKDVRDAIQALLYNIGIVKSRPQLGRYSFDEKVEYWALIWGLIVMVITGFMLWNPIATVRLLPGEFIPAAKAAHGGEALLAFLAILIWHTYHVHIKTFNKSMFTGKMTEQEMAHEHPLELVEIQNGTAPTAQHDKVTSARLKVYLPLAGVMVVVLLVGVYFFLTFEQTSITTFPPAESAPILATRPPTATATLLPVPTSVPNQELTWDGEVGALFRSKCGACHGSSGGLSLKTYADAMKGGSSGPVIAPGAPDNSSLLTLQGAGTHPGQFTPDELALVREWIDAGALEK